MAPLSIRFDAALLARLHARAVATMGSDTSALAQRLVDEGLRMADHPGVVFKDGPTGRRAALAYGPDVWEIVTFLREVDERGAAALDAAAEVFAVDVSRITTAVIYYGDYREEIDAEIAAADEASVRAERGWCVQQTAHRVNDAP
jgi:sarcosine oxidase gamma subunit